MLPFFGVDLTPVRDRLGIGLIPHKPNSRRSHQTRDIRDIGRDNRNVRDGRGGRDHDRSLVKRNQARSKYGMPVKTQWELEIQNVPREVSWQDLKDFIFQKSFVRPSHAAVNEGGAGIGSVSFATPRDMEKVLRKVDGVNLNGKPLKLKEILQAGKAHRREERHQWDRIKTERPDHHGSSSHRHSHHPNHTHHSHPSHHSHHSSNHHSSHRHGEHHKENRNNESTHGRKRRHSQVEKSKMKEEGKVNAKVIIHQASGDKVITEKIDNIDAFLNSDVDASHSDTPSYFKRNRRSTRADRGARDRRRDGRFSNKSRAINKYGVPCQTKWKVCVENLSKDVSWQDLKDLIRPYADVRFADAHKPTPGEAVIYVDSKEDLDNVISNLHNTDIKGQATRFIAKSVEEEEEERESCSPQRKSHSPQRSDDDMTEEEQIEVDEDTEDTEEEEDEDK